MGHTLVQEDTFPHMCHCYQSHDKPTQLRTGEYLHGIETTEELSYILASFNL